MADPEPTERMFSGRISIPYLTPGGVVGVKYRTLTDSGTKYLSQSGMLGSRIFNPQTLISLNQKIYVTEGELDCITLCQLGIPAIGIPGTDNVPKVVGRILRNREVVVLTDGDGKPGAGVEGSARFGKQISSSVDRCGIIQMEGTDVNQFYLDEGEEALKAYIGWRG